MTDLSTIFKLIAGKAYTMVKGYRLTLNPNESRQFVEITPDEAVILITQIKFGDVPLDTFEFTLTVDGHVVIDRLQIGESNLWMNFSFPIYSQETIEIEVRNKQSSVQKLEFDVYLTYLPSVILSWERSEMFRGL